MMMRLLITVDVDYDTAVEPNALAGNVAGAVAAAIQNLEPVRTVAVRAVKADGG
jgi:hypothetical protein